MTARDFDPMLSAALRNELEALAAGTRDTGAPRPVLRRPQLWISVVTAVVLLVATLGVLRLTHAIAPPAAPASTPAVVDPLSRVTDPRSPYSVARAVHVLIDARGVGTGTEEFTAGAGVREMQVYLNCAGAKGFAIDVDGKGSSSSGCDRDSGSHYSTVLRPGAHTVTVRLSKGVAWSLLIIEKPAPTNSTGGLIDPLAQVRDPYDPDALTGSTRPALRWSGSGTTGVRVFDLPGGTAGVRLFFPCRAASASAAVRIDGHLVAGCQNSIAHWFDFTPSARAIPVQVTAPAGEEWSLLAVPAPPGAAGSPATAALPWPDAGGALLARARGTGAARTGTYLDRSADVLVTTTCRGTGWLEITAGSSGTTTRGTACSTAHPSAVGLGGADGATGKRLAWSVIPHGDISWTFQLTTD